MEDVKVIEEFLRPRSGYGYGYGYGDGYGYGSGYGYGYGSGDGYGYGYGYGYGSGSGDGSGYGYGYGSGSGDGSGSGSGDLKTFNGERVWYVDDVPTLIDKVRGNYAKGWIVGNDFTIKLCYIARVENCWAHGDTLKQALADAEAKALEDMPIDERIARFKEAFPTLGTSAKCADFYKWHHILTGSCTMGRDEFVRAHGLNMDADYTVQYFLDITASSYGGNIIKQLKESYK